MRSIFVALSSCLLLFSACTQKESTHLETPQAKKEKDTTAQTIEKDSTALKFSAFAYPQDIEGCSCYFSSSREEFVKQNYLYVDDYQRKAYVKLKDQLHILSFKHLNPEATTMLHIEAQNKQVNVVLQAELVEKGEIETALYQGTLTATDRKGNTTTQEVYGECGC